MIRTISLLIITLLALSSCKKENEAYFEEPSNGYPTIEIDSIRYSYISKDNNYFYEGLFKSKSNIKNFNLKLKANRKYRISASQLFEDSCSINLCLLANNKDTITESQNLNTQKVLYFNSLKEQSLILQTQLESDYNISLDYRLFFEELSYDTLSLNNKSFSYNGHFSDKIKDTCYFFPSNSYWHRLLSPSLPISDTANISYTIKSSIQNEDYEFGFIIAGTKSLTYGNKFNDDLPNGIFFSINNNEYTVTQIENNSSTNLEQGYLQNNINFDNDIRIEIKTDNIDKETKKIFINNNQITSINSPSIDKFYIIFSDRNKDIIRIFNYQTNN